jgi:hypothetical protein
MSRRQSTRIARAVVAVTVAGAALAGCTVTVEGIPQAQPRAVTAPAPPSTSAPALPTRSDRDSDRDKEAAVYAEWVSDGWVPTPILPVMDPDSRTSAWLFGAAERFDPPDGGISYQSLDAPASVVNWFGVFPIPAGYVPDATRGAESTARAKNGRVVSARPVTVTGYPGLDVRIEFTDPQGRPGVDLIRYVELPRHLVGIESLGMASDERVLQQVHDILVKRLDLPTI